MTETAVRDVIVIGGGLAGLTAAMFTARFGHSTLVIERFASGGHLINIENIEDFPGFPNGVAGYDLGPLVQEQATSQGVEFQSADVHRLESMERFWIVQSAECQWRAKTVIIATGSRSKALGIPGEVELRGKGISNCASCDGPLFGDQVVGVVGGGNHALQESLTLATHAAQVMLFHSESHFTAQHVYQKRVFMNSKISLRYNAIVEKILGDDAVKGVALRDAVTGESSEVELAGIFIYPGLQPNTDFLDGVIHLDQAGYIPTDAFMRTERPGIFAAGNIRQESADFAITSASDGALAAMAAHRYINEGVWQDV